MERKKKHPSWIKKLKSRYRLMIINDTNFQEKATIRLTPLNLIMLFSVGLIVFFIFSYLLIYAVPGLRSYMPGHEPNSERKFKNEIVKKINNYEKKIQALQNKETILGILLKGEEMSKDEIAFLQEKIDLSKEKTQVPPTTELKANQAENNEPNYSFALGAGEYTSFHGLFYCPLKGQTSAIEIGSSYKAIKINPSKDETVSAMYEGRILFAGWTPQYSNVIIIQHPNNWVSIYKNCSFVYIKSGSRVKAGETIAALAKTNTNQENSLIFELWHNETMLDPTLFIHFN